MINKKREILAALAQWRHAYLDHIQAVVEILAKRGLLHLGFQISVGGSHDAYVHFAFADAADGLHLTLLEHTQELDLHGQRQVGNFVEQEGSIMGCLEEALLVRTCACEGALDVAE